MTGRVRDDIGLALVVLGAIGLGLLGWRYQDRIDWPYWFAASIGFAVGATEMMARYRDSPFAPLRSAPGIIYFLVNGAAAALAYYLLDKGKVDIPSEPLKILTAGISAMAFFRSGLFTARIGNSDVAVGPNLILQILLQALDRTYDRDRAVPRSMIVSQSMSGVSFAAAQEALPSICFNLMQNVSDDEKKALRDEVDALQASAMSDEAKSLSLGLALLNLVGERTLDAALIALGSSVMSKDLRQVDPGMLFDLAKISPPSRVAAELPLVCNELADRRTRLKDPATLTAAICDLGLPDEGKAMLTVFRVIQQYGESTVKTALSAMHV